MLFIYTFSASKPFSTLNKKGEKGLGKRNCDFFIKGVSIDAKGVYK